MTETKIRWSESCIFSDKSIFQSRISPWSKDKATHEKGVMLKIVITGEQGDELPIFLRMLLYIFQFIDDVFNYYINL